MIRRIFALAVLVTSSVVTLGVIGCSPADNSESWPDAVGLKVLTSFAPVECFARNLLGEEATVRVLFDEQGPHHIKDTPNHVRVFAGADVLYINGLGLEDSNVRRILKGTTKKVPVVSLGAGLPETLLLEGGCSCCKEDEPADAHAHHDHAHHDHDPHIWLGIDQAIRMVELMRDDLKKRNPAQEPIYDSRADRYIAKLKKLKEEGTALLNAKNERQFISFHESLNYFAKSFGLKQPEVIQSTPGQEPTKKELDSLIERCQKKNIRVIALEPQYGSGTSAKAVAASLQAKGLTDVQLIVVDPLETAVTGEMNADWYETKMRANIQALAKALK